MVKTVDNMQNKLKNCIERALDILYEKDQYLIFHKQEQNTDKTCHVSERGIVFRFGIYFDSIFRQNISDNYNIDTEYNRNINSIKEMPCTEDSAVRGYCYPDLIVHQRGNNDNNLLIIEFKTWWNSNQERDRERVKIYMNPSGPYKYKYGAVVLLSKDRKTCTIEFKKEWITVAEKPH